MPLLNILLIIFMIATAIVLGLGLITLFKKKPSAANSNKFMQWRIIFQAIVLIIFGLMFYFSNPR